MADNNDDNDDNNVAPHDVDFVAAMHDLLGIDKEKVSDLLDKLDASEMEQLQDAVAKNDKAAAQNAVGQVEADEAVNSLFRGSHLRSKQERKINKTRRNTDGAMQFAIGDDVVARVQDDKGKWIKQTATVERTDGPEGSDTMIVRIKGKPTVIAKNKVESLEEGVLGMVGMQNLARIQQLAGIQGGIEVEPQPSMEVQIEHQPEESMMLPDDTLACPLQKVMQALDTLDASLPMINVGSLKAVRARLNGLQVSLNETIQYGRMRKR
jgi:hypothetical protein